MSDERSKTVLTPREQDIFGAVMEVMQDALRERDVLIAALGARIEGLEQRKSMAVKGVWHPDMEYFEGDAATDRGSLWLCVRRSRGCRPGSDTNYWTLAVKSGRVG